MLMKHRSRVAQRIVVSLVAIGMAISVHAGQVIRRLYGSDRVGGSHIENGRLASTKSM